MPKAVLREWGQESMVETAELIVSELVTNAVRATTGPEGRPRYDDASGLPVVHLRLSSDRVHVIAEVWDTGTGTPTPEHSEPDQESGRGLMLVQALCERWGWEIVPGRAGKVVWAELRDR
jgi:two-component sensor histidine kinase